MSGPFEYVPPVDTPRVSHTKPVSRLGFSDSEIAAALALHDEQRCGEGSGCEMRPFMLELRRRRARRTAGAEVRDIAGPAAP